MRVWITRSQPGADRQLRDLEAAGFSAVAAPVSAVEETGAASPQGCFDWVFFLSEHAVSHSAPLDFCSEAAVYAVGARTAEALTRNGVVAQVPDKAGSDGLLARAELRSAAGRRALIVAGEDGRKDLRDTLISRGAEVCELLCYRRLTLEVQIESLMPVDVILIASQDGFRSVARLWFEANGSPDVTVLAASDRIAGLGKSLGFQRVEVLHGASGADMVAGLQALEGENDEC